MGQTGMTDYVVLPRNKLEMKLCSLEEAYTTWKQAQVDWYFSCLDLFGYVPDSVLVSKTTYMLLYVYSKTYGNFRSGNWLNLDMMVSYSEELEPEVVLSIDSEFRFKLKKKFSINLYLKN